VFRQQSEDWTANHISSSSRRIWAESGEFNREWEEGYNNALLCPSLNPRTRSTLCRSGRRITQKQTPLRKSAGVF